MLPVCQRCEGHGPIRVHLRGRDPSVGVRSYMSREVDLCSYCKSHFEDSKLEVTEV